MSNLIKYYKSLKERNAFNANNCKKNQDARNSIVLNRKIEELEGRIKLTADEFLDENYIIGSIHDSDVALYPEIKEHFKNLGFTVFEVGLPNIKNKLYVIKW